MKAFYHIILLVQPDCFTFGFLKTTLYEKTRLMARHGLQFIEQHIHFGAAHFP
jgi:hypothetical protein